MMRLNLVILRKFVDSIRVYAKGGPGGMGYPRCGGVGGKGGDVYVIVKPEATLQQVIKYEPSKRWSGGQGGNSRNAQLYGDPGTDVVIKVPPGVSVMSELGTCLGELNTSEDKIILARGGDGGGPNNQFCGQAGQKAIYRLDLKLIADVGLVGFPNAGKSTLLRAISRAKPKVASYPFTTIQPQLGLLEYKDKRQIQMADLPGLIEGAHKNIGLGHRFLRHIERTNVLLMIVDISGFRLSPERQPRSVFDTIVLLNKELELYKEEVLDKPVMLVVNKMDLPGSDERYQRLTKQLNRIKEHASECLPPELHPNKFIDFTDIIPASCLSDISSINTIKSKLRDLVDLQKQSDRDETEIMSNINKSQQSLTTVL